VILDESKVHTCTGCRGIALLFHDHGTRREWRLSVTPWPLFTPGKGPVPIVQEAGWAPGPVWTGAKKSRSPGRPARSQSLYRLRYPAHGGTWWSVLIMAVFIMQLLSFLLRVGLYSKSFRQCSLLATGDQILLSYQSKNYSFVDFCLYRFWRNYEINLNFRSKHCIFISTSICRGARWKKNWFECNQNSNVSPVSKCHASPHCSLSFRFRSNLIRICFSFHMGYVPRPCAFW
jgi:hypothetical protein